MKPYIIVAAIVLLAASAPAWAQGKTVWDRIYNADQAARGKALYAKSCAGCHGASLEGATDKPGLMGPYFLVHWSGKPVSALFDFIAVQMSPPTAPLPAGACADLVAYLFSVNGLPAGPAELSLDRSALKAIAIKPIP